MDPDTEFHRWTNKLSQKQFDYVFRQYQPGIKHRGLGSEPGSIVVRYFAISLFPGENMGSLSKDEQLSCIKRHYGDRLPEFLMGGVNGEKREHIQILQQHRSAPAEQPFFQAAEPFFPVFSPASSYSGCADDSVCTKKRKLYEKGEQPQTQGETEFALHLTDQELGEQIQDLAEATQEN
jgi:hypothetical protein